MARSAYMNLRVRPALKAKLEKLAKQDSRSFSSYVKTVLEDHVKARQASSKGVERNRPKLIRRSDLRAQQ
jgi:predicted transcriptional regulator